MKAKLYERLLLRYQPLNEIAKMRDLEHIQWTVLHLFVNIELPEYLRGVKEMLVFKYSAQALASLLSAGKLRKN